jgi:hypothetical protein
MKIANKKVNKIGTPNNDLNTQAQNRLTALIALLAITVLISTPQTSWAIQPAASRTAALTAQLPARLAAQRAAQQLTPALYPAAARLSVTGRGTPAQTQESIERLRSQTLGQRIADPRNVGSRFEFPRYQSPLSGRTGINPAGSRGGVRHRSFASQSRYPEELKNLVKENNLLSLLNAVSTEKKIIRIIKREAIGNILERTWESWTDNPTKALIKQLFRTDKQYTHIIALVPTAIPNVNAFIKTIGLTIKNLKAISSEKIISSMGLGMTIDNAIFHSAQYNLQETIDILFAYAFAIGIGNVGQQTHNQQQSSQAEQRKKPSAQAKREADEIALNYINGTKGYSYQELAIKYHPDLNPANGAIMSRINEMRNPQEKWFPNDLREYREGNISLEALKQKYNPTQVKSDPVLKTLYEKLSRQIP